MTPLVKYTFGRLGLFLAAFLILWPVPALSLLVKLLVALLVSFTLSWFVLSRWRDELATDLAGKVERRRLERERLRSALAGEDGAPEAAAGDPPEAAEGDAPAGGDVPAAGSPAAGSPAGGSPAARSPAGGPPSKDEPA